LSAATETFVRQNSSRLLEELKEFVRIPSVSTLPEHRPDIDRAASFVAESLRKAGPLIYADWMHLPGKPTVLCYGHYDVQPADPLELWTSPPFEPSERDGNLYARGTADDKGQMYMHIKAVEALQAVNGTLPLNVKFLVEGEEEVGGASIAKYVAGHPDKLRADVALVSDTAMYAEGMPTLCVGLRGLIYAEIEAVGPMRDLHSGLYGGAAPNAVYGLIELLAKAKDANGVLQIPGIYDAVEEPAPAELQSWRSLPFREADFLEKEVGATELTGEAGRSVLERIWSRPTFEVHGIAGGFTSAGSKTVIPATATAKVSFRLVPRQDPDRVVRALEEWVRHNTPRGMRTQVRILTASPGLVVDPGHPAIRVAAQAFSDVFGKPTVFIRSGGSIPVVGDFANHLRIPTVLMGFGLPDDGLHSPNEKYKVENYYKGIMTIAQFFEQYGK
jgi:acetylornithine deacetylase/succinyl-diaminopimelate desuccinylase-like protein